MELLLIYKRFHVHGERLSLPFVELAIDNILRLICRSSGREVQKMRQEFLWHVVKQLVRHAQGFP